MTDQTETSAHDTSGPRNVELIYALAPLYWRHLTAGMAELRIEYDAKEDIGEVRCQARNGLAQNVSSQLNDELTKDVVACVWRIRIYRIDTATIQVLRRCLGSLAWLDA